MGTSREVPRALNTPVAVISFIGRSDRMLLKSEYFLSAGLRAQVSPVPTRGGAWAAVNHWHFEGVAVAIALTQRNPGNLDNETATPRGLFNGHLEPQLH